MKKNDTLNNQVLKPKKSTVDFLLNYSKSLKLLKTKAGSILVATN